EGSHSVLERQDIRLPMILVFILPRIVMRQKLNSDWCILTKEMMPAQLNRRRTMKRADASHLIVFVKNAQVISGLVMVDPCNMNQSLALPNMESNHFVCSHRAIHNEDMISILEDRHCLSIVPGVEDDVFERNTFMKKMDKDNNARA